MKNKYLCLLSAFVIIMTFMLSFSVSVSALSYRDFTYTVTNEEITITDCSTYASGNISIPSTINGYPVVRIGSWAFSSCTSIESIVIPESVIEIESYAFYNCSNLLDITIPDNVTTIGKNSFQGCQKLTTISLPKNLTKIEEDLFRSCNNLKKVSLPSELISIGKNAFSSCNKLTDVVLPNGLESIGEYAFSYCNKLTNIIIPGSVTNIDKSAFHNCGLENVIISEGVKSIGQSAFFACYSLKNITLPNSLENIGDSAFSGCIIESIVIPKNTISLGKQCFYNCSSLKEIYIPNGITSILDKTFDGCGNIKKVYYNGTQEQWDEISFGSNNTDLKIANIHFVTDKHIIYITNGGEGISLIQEIDDIAEFILLDRIPERKNYLFEGWSLNIDCLNVQYKPNDKINVGSDKSIVLYAVWKEIPLIFENATYNQDEGSLSVGLNVSKNLISNDGVIIIAVYCDDRFKTMCTKNISDYITHTFDNLEIDVNKCTLKAFCWSDLTKITPLCASTSSSVQ